MSEKTVTADPKEAPEVEVDESSLLKRIVNHQTMQILFVLLVIVTLFAALNPSAFLAPFNFRAIAVSTAIYAVLGVGVTFIIITAGIDLSCGSVLVCSAVVSSKVMVATGGQGWAVAFYGLLAAVLTGIIWGSINGFLVAYLKLPPFIVTLATFQAALGTAQVITDGIDMRDAPECLVDTVGFGNLMGIPVLVIIAAVVMVIGGIVLHKTRFGLYTYAIGSNIEAARRAGIKADRQLFYVYVLGGTMAGLAGYLNLAFYQSTTLSGQSLTAMNVIAGVAIGGTSLFGGVGTIIGTAIGLFIPSTLQNGFVIMHIQPFWQLIVVGAVLATAVYVDQKRRAQAMSGGKKKKKEEAKRNE